MAQKNNVNEDTISLFFDDVELECDILATFPAQGNNYIALLPKKNFEEFSTEEALLYRYTKSEDSMELIEITDEEEFDIAADAYDELLDEEEFNTISQKSES